VTPPGRLSRISTAFAKPYHPRSRVIQRAIASISACAFTRRAQSDSTAARKSGCARISANNSGGTLSTGGKTRFSQHGNSGTGVINQDGQRSPWGADVMLARPPRAGQHGDEAAAFPHGLRLGEVEAEAAWLLSGPRLEAPSTHRSD